MKSFLFSIPQRLRNTSEQLDAKAILCSKVWEVFNDEAVKQVFIFEEDGSLLISVNGDVINSSWKYISKNKSVVITYASKTILLHPAFINDVVLALQKDGTQEMVFMIDSNKTDILPDRTLKELKQYFFDEENKLINKEIEIKNQEAKERERQLEIEIQRKEEERRRIEEERRRIEEKQRMDAEEKRKLDEETAERHAAIEKSVTEYIKLHLDEITEECKLMKVLLILSIIIWIIGFIVIIAGMSDGTFGSISIFGVAIFFLGAVLYLITERNVSSKIIINRMLENDGGIILAEKHPNLINRLGEIYNKMKAQKEL